MRDIKARVSHPLAKTPCQKMLVHRGANAARENRLLCVSPKQPRLREGKRRCNDVAKCEGRGPEAEESGGRCLKCTLSGSGVVVARSVDIGGRCPEFRTRRRGEICNGEALTCPPPSRSSNRSATATSPSAPGKPSDSSPAPSRTPPSPSMHSAETGPR